MPWELAIAQAADTSYAAAVEMRVAGRNAEAIAALERLARTSPADADVWLNLGLAYLADHRYSAADGALETALRLAPDYQDARVAYARSAYFSGKPALAQARLDPVLVGGGGDDEEARALNAQIQAASVRKPAAWRLDLAYARSELSNGLGYWSATSISLGRRQGRDTVVASVDRTSRFDREDVYVEALGARAFGRDRDAWIALGGAPDADYRPKVALRGGGSARVGLKGATTTRIGLDGAWARYGVGDVRGLQPYVTWTLADRATLTARAYMTLDERDDLRAGYAFRADWSVRRDLRLSAGWADAPESSDGRTVKVRAASVGAAVDLGPALTVQLGYTRETRQAYDRDEVALALTKRF
jgi:YaiO family outer membrane protein